MKSALVAGSLILAASIFLLLFLPYRGPYHPTQGVSSVLSNLKKFQILIFDRYLDAVESGSNPANFFPASLHSLVDEGRLTKDNFYEMTKGLEIAYHRPPTDLDNSFLMLEVHHRAFHVWMTLDGESGFEKYSPNKALQPTPSRSAASFHPREPSSRSQPVTRKPVRGD